MAKHILYSSTESESRSVHHYHLPKGLLHIRLYQELATGVYELQYHPHILPDPDEVYHLHYRPQFTTHESIQVSFRQGGFLKSISTEKTYPSPPKLAPEQPPAPNTQTAKSLPPPATFPLNAALCFETFVDPFDPEGMATINQQLQQFDPGLGLATNVTEAPQSPTPELEAQQPGIVCRPQTFVVVTTQQRGHSTQRLVELPDRSQRQCIEVPPVSKTNSSLTIDCDEWGYPTHINLEKASGMTVWMGIIGGVFALIMDLIGRIVKVRINRMAGEQEKIEAEYTYKTTLSRLQQAEREARVAEQRAQAAEAVATYNQQQLEEQQASLATAPPPRKDTQEAPAHPASAPPKAEPVLPPGTKEIKAYDLRLHLTRYGSEGNLQLGILQDVTQGRKVLANTLEIALDKEGHTPIRYLPPGTYPLQLRTKGGMHNRFMQAFGEKHQGLLQVMDAPGLHFLLPPGTQEDVRGSIQLITPGLDSGPSKDNPFWKVYAELVKALQDGQQVGLQILDL